ncbi:uncharacterized protein LOC127713848 [Mytilus californianus]|uniref:uncharacterized protein LOC127713848 n=1 Tax=Mytilus californianus TaxID=6549 RepID=UPI002246E9B4|nr:uncharacterized protein LOC127713848 [Mytilus californianus]
MEIKKELQKTPPTLKPYFELKHSERANRNIEIKRKFSEVASSLYSDITSIKVELEFHNGKKKYFYPRTPTSDHDESSELKYSNRINDRDTVQQVLMVKDRFRIFDDALHELHMVGSVLPSKHMLVEERKRLNTVVPIHIHPGAANDCSYRCITDILEYIIQKYYQEELIAPGPLDLKLRFACDGAKISKKLNSVRGVMKLLHASMSPDDEHTLFFFTGEENHYSLKKYGHHTFLEMARLQEEGFEIDGKKINVEWILTCDWKALCLLRGINAANSDYFCLWCHCRKREICNFSIKEWPIQRTQTEQNESVANCSTGYIRQDMCSFIDYTSMAPDDLHLRIRLSLKLLNQVVTWAIDQKNEDKLEAEMKRIGASFHFWEERGDDKSSTSIKKWSQPSGDELRKIIKYSQLHNVLDNTKDKHLISVESLSVNQLRNELVQRGLNNKGKKVLLVARLKEAVGNCKFRKKANASRLQVSFDYEDDDDDDDEISLDVDALQTLWGNFHCLMESLRAFPGSEEYKNPELFMQEAREWAQNFRRYTFDEDVTPYLHAMVYHVPYFLEKYRYLHDIGVAQVERKNYDQRMAYFDSTNRYGGKHKKKISEQILQRENRLLWASLEGVKRKVRKYTYQENQ